VIAIVSLNELRGDPQSIGGFAHAALEHMRHHQPPGNSRHILRLALEVKGRGSCRHPQICDLAQPVDHFLRQPIGEIFLILLLAQVEKRQHRH
jgi:hypothetical protein